MDSSLANGVATWDIAMKLLNGESTSDVVAFLSNSSSAAGTQLCSVCVL